jgi:hypothetical protein
VAWGLPAAQLSRLGVQEVPLGEDALVQSVELGLQGLALGDPRGLLSA